MDPEASFQYNGVQFLPTVVACYKGSTLRESVRREDILGVAARYTWLVDHPIRVLGFALLCLIVIGLELYDWWVESRVLEPSLFSVLIVILVAAASLPGMLKRGPVVALRIKKTQRKLPFTTPVDINQVRSLLEGAKEMGYPVDMASLDTFRLPK